VFYLRNHRANGAIFFDRQHRGAASAIVGHEHVLAGGIDGEMARAGVAGGLLVELGQLAGLHVQRERRHAAAPFAVERGDFVDRVKELAVRVNFEERRVFQAVHGAEFFQAAVLQVELKQVNALLVGGRVAAKTDQGSGRCSGRLAKRNGQAKRGESRRQEKRAECHAPDETEIQRQLQVVLHFIWGPGLLRMCSRETDLAPHSLSTLPVRRHLVLGRFSGCV